MFDQLLAQVPASLREVLAQAIEVEIKAKTWLSIDPLQKENRALREELRLLRIEKYGARSEKLTDAQLALLELEPAVHAQEVAGEAELSEEEKLAVKAILDAPETRKPTSRKAHRGRVELPAHLPREEKIVPCAPEQCRCQQCGAEKRIIGFEQSEELACRPAVMFVQVIKREKRACKHCEELGVSTAAVPAKIIPKSKAADGLIVSVLTWKYLEHLPLYRIAARFQREHQVEVSRAVLCDWVMGAGALLQGITGAMRQELLQGTYVQADETPVQVQTTEKTGKNHQAYLWAYSRPGDNVIFDFQMGRSREGPRRMLAGFGGTLQCDGYSAYGKIGGEGMRFAGCWAHVRRAFVNAVKVAENDPAALAIVAKINGLYRVEREARGMAAEARWELRRKKCPAQIQAVQEAILEAQQSATPASTLGKACQYALNQWERLQVYLEDGQIEIDQNLCENAIRPVALGRKNWLHIGSPEAGPRVAAILSVFETCRRLGIDPSQYLLEVLPGLSERPARELANVTPAAWKAARSGATREEA